MIEVFGWATVWWQRYGPIATGLAIGTAAKYGLVLSEGRRPSWLGIFADLLLLGMLGLIAIAICDVAAAFGWNVAGDARVLVGSLAAVSSDRLVRLARDKFMRKVETELDVTIKASSATFAEVPPGRAASTPATAKLTVFRSADPRAAAVERLAEGPLPKNGAEFGQLLDAIDQATRAPKS